MHPGQVKKLVFLVSKSSFILIVVNWLKSWTRVFALIELITERESLKWKLLLLLIQLKKDLD